MERIYLTILVALLVIACEPINPPVVQGVSSPEERASHIYTRVYMNDSVEWLAYVAYEDVYAGTPVYIDSLFHIPTHEEANILRTITFGEEGVRYLTDDGYTFGMPSKSVTKAGKKTKYSVLALHCRKNIYKQQF